MSDKLLIWLHLIGGTAVLMSLASLCWHVLQGGTRKFPQRRLMMLTHGFGLLVILVTGFMLKSDYGIGWPSWLIVKILDWLVLGGLAHLIFRFSKHAMAWWWMTWIVGALAMGLGLLH